MRLLCSAGLSQHDGARAHPPNVRVVSGLGGDTLRDLLVQFPLLKHHNQKNHLLEVCCSDNSLLRSVSALLRRWAWSESSG